MESILGYIKGIAFIVILISFVTDILPDSAYKKYLKIFAGLLLVITIVKPLADFVGIGDTFFDSFTKYNEQFDAEEFESSITQIQQNILDNYVEEESRD